MPRNKFSAAWRRGMQQTWDRVTDMAVDATRGYATSIAPRQPARAAALRDVADQLLALRRVISHVLLNPKEPLPEGWQNLTSGDPAVWARFERERAREEADAE